MTEFQEPQPKSTAERNRELFASYAPIFAEIAANGTKDTDLYKQFGNQEVKTSAVVAIHKDYYEVEVAQLGVGKDHHHTLIHLERLSNRTDWGAYLSIRRITFDTGDPKGLLTVYEVTKSRGGVCEVLKVDLEETDYIQGLFNDFAVIDENGGIRQTCVPVSNRKANRLMKYHQKFVAREFGRGYVRESLLARGKKLGTKALDSVLGMKNDGHTW